MPRTKAHEKQRDYWEIMRESLAVALKLTWEELSETGISVAAFCISHGDAMS